MQSPTTPGLAILTLVATLTASACVAVLASASPLDVTGMRAIYDESTGGLRFEGLFNIHGIGIGRTDSVSFNVGNVNQGGSFTSALEDEIGWLFLDGMDAGSFDAGAIFQPGLSDELSEYWIGVSQIGSGKDVTPIPIVSPTGMYWPSFNPLAPEIPDPTTVAPIVHLEPIVVTPPNVESPPPVVPPIGDPPPGWEPQPDQSIVVNPVELNPENQFTEIPWATIDVGGRVIQHWIIDSTTVEIDLLERGAVIGDVEEVDGDGMVRIAYVSQGLQRAMARRGLVGLPEEDETMTINFQDQLLLNAVAFQATEIGVDVNGLSGITKATLARYESRSPTDDVAYAQGFALQVGGAQSQLPEPSGFALAWVVAALLTMRRTGRS